MTEGIIAMNLIKILIGLSVLFGSSLINAEPLVGVHKNTLPLVAVGDYKQTNEYQPLILTGDRNGAQWTYVPVENTGSLKSVVCNESQCTAIGKNKTSLPLIYSSSDAGYSWQVNKNISQLPANMQSSELEDITCVANICIATGCYHTEISAYARNLPLLLRSNDYGKTWKFNQNINDLTDNFTLDSGLKISCSGQTCVSVARNSSNDSSGPIILVSHDTGQTWKSVKKIENLPADDHKRSLEDVSCDGKNCVAVGVVANSKARTANPIIVYSDNDGDTWNYVCTISGLIPAMGPFTMMSATSINCKDNLCFAGGSRLYPLANILSSYPLLLESRDGGKTWSYKPVAIASPSLKGRYTYISTPSCAGAHCVSVGLYGDMPETNTHGFILSSQNSGKSWDVIKKIEGVPIEFMSQAFVSSVSCFDDQCIATGEYKNAQDKYVPMFLVSKNSGVNWQLNQNISLLPQDSNFFLSGLTGSLGLFLNKSFSLSQKMQVS